MTPANFVNALRKEVINDNAVIFRDLFSNTKIESASDPYWKRALALFGDLSPEQKDVFFEVLRQIAVDTTSNLLGVIDGVNVPAGVVGRLELCIDGNKISGDLQSLFLEQEERAAR